MYNTSHQISAECLDCYFLCIVISHLICGITGLNGNPRLADIGGPPYLTPLPQLNKVSS
jgi:hypothetical protein